MHPTVRSSQTFCITPRDDSPYGADLEIDFRRDLDGQCGQSLRRSLAEHQFLVLHGGVTEDQHVRLVAALGRILVEGPRVVIHAPAPPGPPRTVIHLSNSRPDGINGDDELRFHHELAYRPTPYQGLSLYAEEIGDGAATTKFASGRRAYSLLPRTLQQQIDRLQGLFVANYNFVIRNLDASSDPTWPRAVHPIALPHPATGDRSLFLSQTQTDSIVGLPRAESEELVQTLFGYLFDPANIVEYHWTEGDLIIWDNLMLQHARPPSAKPARRTLRRVVFGEKSPWEEWPQHAEP